MEQDDGKEFIMVNLIQFNPSPVTHPDTGEGVTATGSWCKIISSLYEDKFFDGPDIRSLRAGLSVVTGCLEHAARIPGGIWLDLCAIGRAGM